MENNANQLNSMLCKKNCGFFGNAAYDGYCSKCYKDHVKRQNSGSAAGRVTPTDVNNSNSQQVQSSNNLVTVGSTTSNQLSNTNNSSTAPIPIPNRINSNNNFKEDPSNIISINNDSTQIDSSNVSNQTNPIASSCTSDASGSLTSTSLTSSSVGSEKKKRTRCCVDSCKRKVGLTGFDCRCGGLFCWEHRYSDKHDCKFDYKELGQDQIRKNNPIVVGEKIQKI